MMDVIAPDSPITEQEFSDARGRQKAIRKGRKKYRRTSAEREGRRTARQTARGLRRQQRKDLRDDVKAGKITRKQAREKRKNWRKAGKERFTTALKDEFKRVKSTWDDNKKKRQANRKALDTAKPVLPIPPKGVSTPDEATFVKKLDEVVDGKKPQGDGSTKEVDPKNQVKVPGPGGTEKVFDKEDTGGKPIKQNKSGEGAVILGPADVELVENQAGSEDFYHTADVATDGWWDSLGKWGKVGVVAGALTIGVLGTWGIVKLVQRGKKGGK